MFVLALTGGIASGKSTALRYLIERSEGHLSIFDCDLEVARLYDSGRLNEALCENFGARAVTQEGKVDRTFLRERVFADPKERERLEQMIHPVLRQECLAKIDAVRHDPSVTGFVIDIPLFYETGMDCGQDAVCVVATSLPTQKMRLARRNGFDEDMIDSILAAQLPMDVKLRKADIVLWNEGPESLLLRQTECLYQHYFR